MLSHARIWSAIDRLAERNELTASGLARRAGLDPTTFNKSKRISVDGRLRWPSTESIAKILDATRTEIGIFLGLGEVRPVRRPTRQVPLLGLAEAGAGGFFDDGGFPAGHGWDEVDLPVAEAGENVFALEVSGDSMLPLYRKGDRLIVARDAPCAVATAWWCAPPKARSCEDPPEKDAAAGGACLAQPGAQAAHALAPRCRLDRAHRLGKPMTMRWAGAILLAGAIALWPAMLAAAEVVQPADRNVSPPGVAPLPAGNGPLIREPVPPKPPEPARWHRYFLPATTDAATFSIKDLTIRIAGVTRPQRAIPAQRWEAGIGRAGRTALFALRRFLHGRAVECFFPYAEGVTSVIAPCRVGETDLGLWLLTAGWARPGKLATDAYMAAANAAECDRLGLWQGEAPPASCPSSDQAKG